MKRFVFILKRIKDFDYRRMFVVAKKIGKITHKPSLFIVFDMLYCAVKFGAGYMDYFEFEFYLLNNSERQTYLTVEMNNRIIANYNDKESMKKFKDKAEFDEIFKDFIKRDFINLSKVDDSEFASFVKKYHVAVAKKPNTMGGKGIYFVEERDDLNLAFNKLVADGYTLLEEYIKQDERMNVLYGKSVNSLRMITFVDDLGDVQLLNVVLKIGNGGRVDNFSSGGMYAFVNEDGEVITPAIDEEGNRYSNHPLTGTAIVGFVIPEFSEAVKLVKKAALVIKEVRYIGWDVAISQNGPMILEGNEYSGIFQKKPSLSKEKVGLLPLYQKYMKL